MAEIGQVSRANVSAHTRARIHYTRIYPTEKRALVANFNGIIPAGAAITQAQWRMEYAFAVAMINATATTRETQVMVQGVYRGRASIKAQVTIDNGDTYNQLFVVEVEAGPWFGDEASQNSGPTVLNATP